MEFAFRLRPVGEERRAQAAAFRKCELAKPKHERLKARVAGGCGSNRMRALNLPINLPLGEGVNTLVFKMLTDEA